MTGDRPRALWLIKGLGTGGAERLLVSTAGAIREEADVHVVHLWRQPDRLRPELERANVPVTSLAVDTAVDPRWLLRLRRLVRAHPYDVVHVHGAGVAVAYRLLNLTLPRSRRPRVVMTQHNDWAMAGRLARLLERATYRLDGARFAVSRATWESLPRSMRARTEVLVHGVPVDALRLLRAERARVRRELGAAAGDVVAMTVANVRPEKGYPDLLAAAATALRRAPGLRFVAMGGGPLQSEEQLRVLAGSDELEERFAYLGVREDAVRLMAGADLFVMPSLTEGFPIALMEALVMGLPVVGSGVGGIAEAIRDGREGLLTGPGRPDELADALVAVALDPELRDRMSFAAAARGESYDIRRAARRTAQVYRALAGCSRPEVRVADSAVR